MRSVNVAEKLADRLALNPQEIVAMTGVGRNTIYAALVIGELRGKRIGVKKWIVPVDEIKRWLSEG
jgi:excisionase family DNA binding protein